MPRRKKGSLGLTAAEIDKAVEELKPLATRSYKQKIAKGLYVLVKPNSAKLWRWDYAFKGARRTFAIGSFPETNAEAAAAALKQAKADVKAGIDPVEKRRKAEAAPEEKPGGPFFLDTITAYRNTRLHMAPSSVGRDKKMAEYLCDGFDSPEGKIAGFGSVETKLVTYRHLQPMLKHFNFETRRRLIEVAQKAISWGRANNHWPHQLVSPFDGISASEGFAPHQTKNRPAITEATGLADLLQRIDDYETLATQGTPRRRRLVRFALQLLPYVFVRPGTLEMAEWKEFDLDAGFWIVPFAKLKMRTERAATNKPKDDYIVPLPKQAVAILRELKEITGHSRFLFPGVDRPATAKRKASSGRIAKGTINDALHDLGYKGTHCGHGWRSTASTMLNRERVAGGRRRFETALVEMQQDRLDASTRAIYDRDDRLPERIELMQFWADRLDAIRKGAQVLPFAA
ncbi:integrase arm-type DNA-binding domain-containing protein [Bradyrhizobium sp. CCGUVB1N3]|uniref:tyrosine-type recombinase/integrase n=1 Tax=Bradyrhizobium sp. CCGUVB1N3 TaxID=2949629 RepID=UPI0020B43EEA|nr:site-specific integrase [Bradyrhizobium sp. CCGUVB1N3]MCP3475176.1 integrase arm-type DNA-binding domain-containing protein [Bradyrhizobium sp. CCGUVB1N3]